MGAQEKSNCITGEQGAQPLCAGRALTHGSFCVRARGRNARRLGSPRTALTWAKTLQRTLKSHKREKAEAA